MQSNPTSDVWLTVSEAAGRMGVSSYTARRLVQDGHVKAIRLPGGHYRVSESSVEELLAKSLVEVASDD